MLQHSLRKYLYFQSPKKLSIGNLANLKNNLHNTTDKQDEALEKLRKDIAESNKTLKWRPKPEEKSGAWKSKFRLFQDPDQNSDLITTLQQPINLSPESIRKWWQRKEERKERLTQSYIRERHQVLGSDLAVAHFVVFRGGSVRFTRNPKWIRADKNDEFDLPKVYNSAYKLEAIKCDSMRLHYEGLENIRYLSSLKFWSLHNCETIDDWCLDRISGAQNPSLEVLDLSGTSITFRGLNCLYRIPSLKLLILDDPKISEEMELSCAMLEAIFPKLTISPSKDIHDL